MIFHPDCNMQTEIIIQIKIIIQTSLLLPGRVVKLLKRVSERSGDTPYLRHLLVVQSRAITFLLLAGNGSST